MIVRIKECSILGIIDFDKKIHSKNEIILNLNKKLRMKVIITMK